MIFSVALRAMELSKHGFNEMPDFTLGVLQSRFSAKNLEQLYKKYEQRYQLSKSDQREKIQMMIFWFAGNFTIFLLVQSVIHFGMVCFGLTHPSTYCYQGDEASQTNTCR